jgi:hypothetical protein
MLPESQYSAQPQAKIIVTHLTQRGVWGGVASSNILFSPPGAGYARAWWRKGGFLEGCKPSKPPA